MRRPATDRPIGRVYSRKCPFNMLWANIFMFSFVSLPKWLLGIVAAASSPPPSPSSSVFRPLLVYAPKSMLHYFVKSTFPYFFLFFSKLFLLIPLFTYLCVCVCGCVWVCIFPKASFNSRLFPY